jgi:prevent-host-death family protein
MKTVSALEVRRSLGRILDEAAAGEQIVIERAGQPIAALIPMSDFHEVSVGTRRQRRLDAIAEIQRLARRYPIGIPDPAAHIREQRRLRDEQVMRAVRGDDHEPT